jgi:hypothetical protein
VRHATAKAIAIEAPSEGFLKQTSRSFIEGETGLFPLFE